MMNLLMLFLLAKCCMVRALLLHQPAPADHADMRVHRLARAGGIAPGDEPEELAMRVEHMTRNRMGKRAIARGPRHVLQRYELIVQHAIARGVGHSEMELEAEAGEQVVVVDGLFGPLEKGLQPPAVVATRVARGERRSDAPHRTLRAAELFRPAARPR